MHIFIIFQCQGVFIVNDFVLLFCNFSLLLLFSFSKKSNRKSPYVMASTSRDRDKGQKYLNSSQKQALAKARAAENENKEVL